MPGPTDALSDARSEYARLAPCFDVLRRYPHLFVYPLLAGAFVVAATGAALATGVGATSVLPGGATGTLVLLVPYLLVVPIVVTALGTALAFEVNEAYEGRHPRPLSGVRRVRERWRLVVLGGVTIGTGGFLVQAISPGGLLGEFLDGISDLGPRLLMVFLFPAIATTDGSPRAVLDDLLAAVESEPARTTVTAVGTKSIGLVICWSGIAAGMGAFVLTFAGVVPVLGWPFGLLTLPVLLAGGGVALSVAVMLAVRGVVQTALFRYAVLGSYPSTLGDDHESLRTATASGAN